jgi:hypothetical protein
MTFKLNTTEFRINSFSSDAGIEKVLSVTPITSINPIKNIGAAVTRTQIDSTVKSALNSQKKYTLSRFGVKSVIIPTIDEYILDKSPISSIDVNEWSGTGTLTDTQGMVWSPTSATKTTVDDKESINLNSGYLETATATTIGQYYTQYYIWWPRTSNAGWRTLFRGDNDHWVIVQDGTTNLGMYTNRGGSFRDTGYDITPSQWQTLIVVGEGDSPTSATGTQTYFVNGVQVGTTDYVASGTNTYRLGWPSQSPGLFISAGILNTALSLAQVTEFEEILQNRFGGSAVEGYVDISGQGIVENIYSIDSNNPSADYSVGELNTSPQITQIVSTQNPVILEKSIHKIVSNSKLFSYTVNTSTFNTVADSDSGADAGDAGGGGSVVVSSGPTQVWY